MTSFEQRKTPAVAAGEFHTILGVDPDKDYLATNSIPHSGLDRGEIFGQQLNGIHIVVAEIKPVDGEQRFRRRFYASLDSAQKAADRTRMNGKEAYLYLGQVHIIGGDHLD